VKSFADLKGLGKQLKEQEEQRAAAEKEAARQQKAAAAAANVFQSSMAGVQKMKPSDRYVPPPAKGPAVANRPAPGGKRGPQTAEEQAADDAAVLQESMLSDMFEVDHYLEEDPSLNFSAPGIGPDVMKKMRKGHWPVQDELDLHGKRRDEARQAVDDFLLKAKRRNYRCVCVIYGRGFGSRGGEPVLKSMVHSWLVQTDGVIAFCQARAEEGGEGAIMVLLRSALQPVR
jgi:DNA-nicking Smr family endonuclease